MARFFRAVCRPRDDESVLIELKGRHHTSELDVLHGDVRRVHDEPELRLREQPKLPVQLWGQPELLHQHCCGRSC